MSRPKCLDLDYYPTPIVYEGHLYRCASVALEAQYLKDKSAIYDVVDMNSKSFEAYLRKNVGCYQSCAKDTGYYINRACLINSINTSKFTPGVFPEIMDMICELVKTDDSEFNILSKDFDTRMSDIYLLGLKHNIVSAAMRSKVILNDAMDTMLSSDSLQEGIKEYLEKRRQY